MAMDNSSFAEQENAYLAKLKAGAIHMSQATLLWVVRYYLYRRSEDKEARSSHLHRDFTKRARFAAATDAAPPAGAPPVATAADARLVRAVLGDDELQLG